MTASFPKRDRKRFVVALLGGTILTAVAMPAFWPAWMSRR